MEKHNTTYSCFWPSILKTFVMDLNLWIQATEYYEQQLVFILLPLFFFSNVIHIYAGICPPSFAFSPLKLYSKYAGFGPVILPCALGEIWTRSNHVVIRSRPKYSEYMMENCKKVKFCESYVWVSYRDSSRVIFL